VILNQAELTTVSERSVLGAVYQEPTLFAEIALTVGDFERESHRLIWQALTEVHKDGKVPEPISVKARLKAPVDAYFEELQDGVDPRFIQQYASEVRAAARERDFHNHCTLLAQCDTLESRQEHLAALHRSIEGGGENWRQIFHSYEELRNAPPLRFAINNFLPEAGISLIGGLSGHGKTFILLSMVRALLEGSCLFGHDLFSVPAPAGKVLYLIPESAIGPFMSRLKMFGLENFLRDDRLMVRTLQHPTAIAIGDPRLLQAAKGAHVFIDTLVRLMEGDENSAESTRPFADDLFKLIGAGALSIVGAHHSPKSLESQDFMTLENVLRGSGDIGAALSTCWGIRQIDAESNSIYVQNCKPRDFQPCQPFILRGRPDLDERGAFLMLHPPGQAGLLADHIHSRKDGRPTRDDKASKLPQALELRAQGKGESAIAKALGVPRSTVQRWLWDFDKSQTPGSA
jgi:hypothetical protein